MKNSKKLIMVSIFLGTMILSAAFSILNMNLRRQRDSENEYKIISASVYGAVESEILKPIYISVTMSNDTFLMDFLKNEDDYSQEQAIDSMARYLSALKKASGAQTAFLVSDGSKRYYTADGLNKIIDTENDDHDIWYSIFVNTRKPYDLDVDTDQVNKNLWTVFVNARIEDETGKILGVCGIGLSMDKLQELLVQYEKDYSIKVNFIDSNGLVQVDTDAVNIENSYLYDVQYGKEKDGYTYTNAEGEYVVMRFEESLNWYLVIHGKNGSVSIGDWMPIVAGAGIVVVVNLLSLFLVGRRKK